MNFHPSQYLIVASRGIEVASKSPRMDVRRLVAVATLCSAFTLSLVAQTPSVTLPPEFNAPQLDARVDRSKTKKANERKGNQESGERETDEQLDQKVAAGDLAAAIAKTERAKKNKKNVGELQNAAAVEGLIDQGVARGVPDAIRAKGVLEAERGKTDAAASHLRNASSRGVAAADYELAALKARQPNLAGVTESPVALLNKAAARGDAEAAMELGLALERGAWLVDRRNVVRMEQSDQKAFAWMERAALLGSEEAAFWLAVHHMRSTKSLVDVSRVKALELFLLVRRTSDDLREPSSGKTFAEFEAAGMIEEGLLAEIKRRERKEAEFVEEQKNARGKKTGGAVEEVKAAWVKYFDNQQIEIEGDASRPVYNLLGFSPYRDLIAEGAIIEATADRIRVDALLPISDVAGLKLEVFDEGSRLHGGNVQSVDSDAKSIRTTGTLDFKVGKKTIWRVVRYHTFYSAFGADNRAGLKPGSSAAAADEVVVYDAQAARWRRLYFHGELAAWHDRDNGPLQADFELVAGMGLLVKRTESGTIAMTVRGVLPGSEFTLEPGTGVALVSTHKNEWGASAQGVIQGSNSARLVAAADAPVMTSRGKTGKWTPERGDRSENWWQVCGIGASDLINLGGATAIICERE